MSFLARILALWLTLAACAHADGVPRTTEHDPSLPAVTLRGYRFHAEAHGDPARPVLIVLHGGPGADYRYLQGLAELADQYRVVFYDQRGSGLSPRVPAEGITVAAYLADLDAFVDHFGQGRRVHLLGHSWGAMLASAYAGAHPVKVGRLVLAEPGFLDADALADFGASGGGWPGWRVVWGFARAWVAKWFVRSDGDAWARDDWFLQQALLLMQGPDALCDGRLPPLQAWRGGSPAFQATLGRMLDDPAWAASLDFRPGDQPWPGPTLFVTGACNRLHGAAYQRRHLRHFSQVRLVEIAQAGHFMFNDRPERSVAVVRAFLAE
ncbi:alpha/beta fold hydrolase [Aquabacterium sp. OR-4]|uniref:alpha/beta fold hydrolase n=1 Tax=Aquabacterium sp. OR-4 TaxID=2978127 RepID=UPI0028C7D7DA|nr:alpha/beta hydrolase [Aquabacterium sp. OR-4]MDT7837601.1 alpha/beta hydrolase [Aquabacterium sp. OR-4]